MTCKQLARQASKRAVEIMRIREAQSRFRKSILQSWKNAADFNKQMGLETMDWLNLDYINDEI